MKRWIASACLLTLIAMEFLGAPSATAQTSSTYAPIRFWNVRNWYPNNGPEWLNHRYSTAQGAFSEWVDHGVKSHGYEAPCGTFPDRPVTWEYAGTYFIQSYGYETDSLSNAWYLHTPCNGTPGSGPHTYGSSAIRYWGCTDGGPWYDPTLASGIICTEYDSKPNPEVNRGAPECPDHCAGDPINTSNGAKFEFRTEYIGPGAQPLELTWTYNSNGVPGNALRADRFLGRNRSHSYMRRVSVFAAGSVSTAYVARPDGKSLRFNLQNSLWVPAPNVDETLQEIIGLSGTEGWVLRTSSGSVEYFGADGALTRIESPSGALQIVRDQEGRPLNVVDDRGRVLTFVYSTAGLLSALQLPDGNSIGFEFNASEDLTKVTYADGTTREYRYDESGYSASSSIKGLLTGVIDEAGVRYSSTAYDSEARATSTYLAGGVDHYTVAYTNGGWLWNIVQSVVTEPLGATRTIAASVDFGRYRATSVTKSCAGCLSQSKAYIYGSDGRPDSITISGITTEIEHNSQGLEIKRVESANNASSKRTIETDWSTLHRLPTERRTKNSSGALTAQSIWSYNSRGQIESAQLVNPASLVARTTSYRYCEQGDFSAGLCPSVGLLLEVDGARTDVEDSTAYEYRGSNHSACTSTPSSCPFRMGDLWKVTNAAGQTSEVLAYDGAGRPLAVKDANGIITEAQYHPRGWVSSVIVRGATPPEDRSTTYEYWPTGLVKRVIDPDGAFTSFEYDNAHRLTAIVDSSGNRIEYTLDAAGNRIAENTKGSGGALKRTLSRVYNTLGQLATQADAQANPTDFTYDAVGNAKTVTDALGHVTSNDYDPLNRLKRTLQDVGGIEAETKFEYDANDNLTKVIDPKGLDTTYTYNGFGDLVQLSSPDTGVTTYTYDSAGNRASQTDARGITTTYQYDALDRLTQVGYPTSSLNVSYTYDVTQPVCQAGETFSVGRLTLMVDGSGSTQYCHDRFGQMVRKVQTTNGMALTLQYVYTKGGLLQAMTYPDGTVVDYVRNAQGQITEVGVAQPGQAREVLLTQATYHPFGPIAGWVYGNGRVMQRDVDLDYRPTSIQGGPGGLDLTYGYDAVGNLTSLASGSPPPLEYGYDALGRLTESRDGPTQAIVDQYTYDKTGNRTSYTDSLGTKSYAYPSTSHRLISVAGEDRTYDAVGNTLSIGTAREFDYNDAGRMSQVRNGGVVAMEYAYNGRGEQVRKHLGASETQALFDDAGHWLGNYGTSGVALQQAIWMDDVPVGLVAGGSLKHVQPDHLGTPRAVIDPVSNVAVWTWDVKSEGFGSTAPQQDPDGNSIPFVLDMRFPGQRFDSATGMLQNWHRDMDPATGRYSQSDPVGMLGGVSTYNYALANPLSWLDRDGLQAERTPAMPSSPTPGSTPVRPFPAGPAANDALFGPKHSWGSAARTVVGACASPTVLAIVVLSAVPNTLQGCDQPAANDECRGDCPPCDPPVGTIMYRLDGPASDRHYNKYSYPELGAEKGWVPTPHLNLYVQSQSPPSAGCKCWARNLRLAVPPPAQPGWVQMGKSR